jgi:hydrophobic/amphiphilic exporter-1 (mainly G- bacteria), HAE1 family
MTISEFSIHKPISTIMVALSFLVIGAISLTRLPLEYAPDLSWPTMYVNVSYPSSSPDEVQRAITRPVEEVMATLSGVKGISSRSYDSRSSIRLAFGFGTDMDMMSIQVRDRLDAVRGLLPDDIGRIETRRWSTDDWEILDYRLTWKGENQSDLLSTYKNTILPRLQRLPGVGNVEIEGVDEKVLLVQVDQQLLQSYGLDIRSLNRAIRANNINISAGNVEDSGRKLAVRLVGEFDGVDQIRNLPVREGLTLGDVANVTYEFPEKRFFERLDGREAVSVEIRKSSTANLVATANLVKREMEAIQKDVGEDLLGLRLTRDQSDRVTGGIQNLAQSAILGGILATVIIFLFLGNLRSTLMVGSAIPISVLCVFMIMYFMRQFAGAKITLNMVSMMGLMVAIGMLVDPAVVVLENIFRKRFDDGQDAISAAEEGSREIGMPVVAAALTTVCVFVPLIFGADSGRGMWMRDFATTVCISVVASMGVALTLIPLAGSRAFANASNHSDRYIKWGLGLAALSFVGYLLYVTGVQFALDWLVGNVVWLVGGLTGVPVGAWVFVGFFGLSIGALWHRFRKIGIKPLYVRVVGVTLRYRWTTVSAATALLIAGWYVYGQIERRPYRWQSTRRITYTVDVPRNYSIDDRLAFFKAVEDSLLPRKAELDIEAIRTRFSSRRGNRISLYLTSAEKATLSTDEVKKAVVGYIPKDIPGVQFREGRGGSGTAGVSIEVKGRNPTLLAVLAEDIKMRMQDLEGVHEVETSLESGQEEVQVTVNRTRAQRYGLSPREIASSIATALGTRGNSKYKTDDGEIDITLQLKEEDRATLEQLKNVQFEGERGNMVSFASLAEFAYERGPRSIERKDRMCTVDIYASTERSTLMKVGREMRRRMEQYPLPEGYSWQMDQRFRDIAQEQSETNFTVIFAMVLIYLIMASLFESYVHPFTIMFSIGFAFIGVAFGLYALNVPLDSNTTYGLLILFGIVVNNGIVLVDQINRYRKQGLSRKHAIFRGGQDRLRPVMMTAITTILGLLPLVIPMLYGSVDGYARMWGPIGLVIICGLSVATVLTLVLLPTVYSLMDDLAGYFKKVAASARV